VGLNETYPGGMVPEHQHDTEEDVVVQACFHNRETIVRGSEPQLAAGLDLRIKNDRRAKQWENESSWY
jgi:hypothetical protein